MSACQRTSLLVATPCMWWMAAFRVRHLHSTWCTLVCTARLSLCKSYHATSPNSRCAVALDGNLWDQEAYVFSSPKENLWHREKKGERTLTFYVPLFTLPELLDCKNGLASYQVSRPYTFAGLCCCLAVGLGSIFACVPAQSFLLALPLPW